MRLAFFGGSFDPPHFGHLAIATAAAKGFDLNEILFAPTGRQPLKPTGPSASFADRFNMVKLLTTNNPTFSPSPLEAPLSTTPNFTVDTLRYLRESRPSDSLYSILGLDAFLGIRRWRDSNELFELADWIVVTRPGFAPSDLTSLNLTPNQRGRVHLLEGIAHPASATEIRARLRAGSSCTDLLPPTVLTYIRTHNLYGT